MQREMPWLGEPKKMQNAPDNLIHACKHGLDAIRLCVQLSGMSNEYLCEMLHIDKGHFSRIMQGKAWFPDTKRTSLMELCGNRAPAQFDAWKTGCELVELSKDAKIRELEEQLAQLRRAA